MSKILVGIDGSARGEAALAWAAAHALCIDASITLLTVMDTSFQQNAIDTEELTQAVEQTVNGIVVKTRKQYPTLEIDARVVAGRVVDVLIQISPVYDLIVLGTHGATATNTVTGGTGLRVSSAVDIPVAIIPTLWSAEELEAACQPIVVGVGPDEVSDAAIDYALHMALAQGKPLKLLSVWGLPRILSKPAAAMGGEYAEVGVQFQHILDAKVAQIAANYSTVEVEGVTVEASNPAEGLLEASKQASVLVLGTHARGVVGRAVFGSVTYGVVRNLEAPTIIVP